jgi:hypothetical protein
MKTVLLLCIILFTRVFGFAQGAGQPPKCAQEDLQRRFGQAGNARWEKEGDHFEAEWRENGREVAVLYDAAGKYILTEREIAASDLPETIMASVNASLPGAQVLEAERQEDGNRIRGYQVELRHQGHVKEITFDAGGNVLTEELEGSGDQDGDGVDDGTDGSDVDDPTDPDHR